MLLQNPAALLIGAVVNPNQLNAGQGLPDQAAEAFSR